jgi:hypothetical protein
MKIKANSNCRLGKERGFWERRGYSDSANVWKNDRYNR